ncbi:MAG TPA: ABC transporter substrate-binding protein [Thermomicrobiales bacterium]|nr:ABC transporter substrate-binding protein [Thermomicrobiales bacterium]
MSDPRVDSLVDEALRLRLSRRSIMRRGAALGLSTAAVAGVLSSTGRVSAAPRAATFIQERQLNILQASYFVPEGEEFFNQAAQEWGSQNGVTVTADYIGWNDLQPRIAAAVEGGSGADIIEMWDIWPYLYQENMVPVDDLAMAVSEEYGGFYDWVVDTASVDGKWYSVPHGNSSSAFTYRISLVEEAGISDPKNNFPQTYEELFALGKTLKEMGKPFGQAMGHSQGDPPSFAYPFMWAHGAMEVEEDGTTVAINKPEFVEALQAFTQHWKDAYDETGLSWDDGANNRAFLSDQISGTLNGSSVYLAAVKAAEGASTLDYEVQVQPDDIWHAGFPEGPAGRFNALGSRSFAAMSYSPNTEAAVEFLAHFFTPEIFIPWLESQGGYIIPMAPGYADLEIYTGNPALAPYPEVSQYSRAKGYAGPSNQKASEAAARYVIVDTIARAIQTGDAAGAVQQAEAQLQRIYGG